LSRKIFAQSIGADCGASFAGVALFSYFDRAQSSTRLRASVVRESVEDLFQFDDAFAVCHVGFALSVRVSVRCPNPGSSTVCPAIACVESLRILDATVGHERMAARPVVAVLVKVEGMDEH